MFGERLKSLRQSAQMTQQQVADKLGVSRAAYSHFENGRNEPDRETIIKLTDIFDVSADFLLTGIDGYRKQWSDSFETSAKEKEKIDTIAAHIDDNVSDDEMKEILSFIDYIKKRDHNK